MTFPYCHNMYKQKNCQSICAILPQFILLKCDMSNEANKFHAYSYKIKRCWHHDYTLPKCRIHYLDITAIRYHPLKRKIYDDFLFLEIFVILSGMIFVGTLPIYVIFHDMLHCFAKKICLYPKHFSLVIQTPLRWFLFLFVANIRLHLILINSFIYPRFFFLLRYL